MTFIVNYQKQIDEIRTISLVVPHDAENMHSPVGTELCTIDGVTYVALPDGTVLPAQPAEIAASVSSAPLDAATKQAIAEASPHVRLIKARVIEKIREKYSAEDEIKVLRLNLSGQGDDFAAYNAHVESCRQWGREEKAKLGL